MVNFQIYKTHIKPQKPALIKPAGLGFMIKPGFYATPGFTGTGDGWTSGQTDRQICDQLACMKAIKHCTCNHRLLTSMKMQIGINL